jgi:hypothetical protein
MPGKPKTQSRPAWTLYALLTRRPFADDTWLRRWLRLKQELGLTR